MTVSREDREQAGLVDSASRISLIVTDSYCEVEIQ